MNFSEVKARIPFQTQDQYLIFFSLLIILLSVIILPLGAILVYSFAPSYPLTEPFRFTFTHYAELLSDLSLLVDITVNTLIYATGTVVVSLSIGLIAAILEEKYFAGESPFRYLMLLPYGIPVVASLTGWIYLLGRSGVITELIMNIFNLSNPPFDIYTLTGMIFVDGVHTAPLAFLLLSPSIRSIPAAVDEAALTAGASRLTVYRKIILPLIGPSIISISVFLYARGLAAVTVPAVLGVPKSIYTFGSAIPFLFLSGFELNYSVALAFSVFITIVSAVLMLYYYRATKKAEKYTTVSGQGSSEPRIYDIGIVKKSLVVIFFVGYLFVAGILPLFAIVWDSVLPTFEFTLDFSTMTLENYVLLFTEEAQGVDNWWRALKNTLAIGLAVPTAGMLVAFLISYSNQSLNLPYSDFTAFLASVPLAIPTITISLGFLVVFIRTPLYGTVLLLAIAFMARAIPVAMRYTSPAVTKLGKENIEAANVCGYRELRSFKNIVLPLTSNDFIAGWMHLFVFTIRNVSIPILLYTTGSEVVAVQLLYVLQAAYFKVASAIAVVITILSIIPFIFLQYWRTKRMKTEVS